MEKEPEPDAIAATPADIEDTTLEVVKPKQKREYVMTEKRVLALERMRAGRDKKNLEINAKKESDKAILDAVKIAKISKKKKPVVVYESSSEEEQEIIVKKRRKPPIQSRPPSPEYEYEPEPVIPFRLKRM
jgi:uncharacterized protein YwgA